MSATIRKTFTILLGLVLSALLIGAYVQRQNIYDWWRLRDYEPPIRVVQVADKTTMNDYGRKLFYVHRPEFQDSQAFNNTCHMGGYSIVLGCFISGRGIYIYDVQDERLSGIHEVTAAHEMLHAAYERLDEEKRNNVDRLLANFFNDLHDERIRETIALYTEQDASVVPNELHSIIGTEVRDLPDKLEAYYRQYFFDRQAIVSLAEQYEQAFVERKNKVRELDAQLRTMRQEIEILEQDLTEQFAVLEGEQRNLDELRSNEEYEEYNQRIPAYNEQVRQYNANLNRTRNLIQEYNRLVNDRNAVASEEQELIEAIDSRRLPGAQ